MNIRETILWVFVAICVVGLVFASNHGKHCCDGHCHDCECEHAKSGPLPGKPNGPKSPAGLKFEDLTLRMMPDNQPPDRHDGPNGHPVLDFSHGW